MLSYKLKHLCSRVIASLSAVGLFSITNTGNVHATTLEPYTTATNSFSTNATFTATYVNDTICDTPEKDPRIVTGFAGKNGAGNEVCTYVLKPGYALEVMTGYCIPYGEDAAYYEVKDMSQGMCEETVYSGVLADTYSGTTISGLMDENATAERDGHVYAQVLQGYERGDFAVTQHVVTVPRLSDGTTPLPAAVGLKQIRIDFSCGVGEYNQGGTGVVYVRYGKQFMVPGENTCQPKPGQKFDKWSDGK